MQRRSNSVSSQLRGGAGDPTSTAAANGSSLLPASQSQHTLTLSRKVSGDSPGLRPSANKASGGGAAGGKKASFDSYLTAKPGADDKLKKVKELLSTRKDAQAAKSSGKAGQQAAAEPTSKAARGGGNLRMKDWQE